MKLKLNPNKTLAMLVEKAEVLRAIVLSTFDGTHGRLLTQFRVIVDPALLLEKPVNTIAKRHSISFI